MIRGRFDNWLKKENLSHLLAVFLVCLLTVSFSFLGFRSLFVLAADPTDAEIDQAVAELNKQIDAQRAKIDALLDQIEKNKDNIANTKKEAVTLKNQMYIIDNQIAKINLDIQTQQEEVKRTQLEIEKTDLQITESEKQIAKNKEQLTALIRLLGEFSEKSYLEILVSNDSFSDFFDQIKFSKQIQKEMQSTLNKVEVLVSTLNSQKDDLNKKKDRLTLLLKKLEDQNAVLGDQKENKQFLIVQTKKSEVKFQKMVDDLRQQQSAANAQIVSIEAKIREQLKKKGSKEKFNTLGSAELAWPTTSHRLTSFFHDPDYPYRNLFEHSGIDIGVKQGTPVYAAEDGYIAKAAFGTKWYGNYVMIIHNNNLSTLYGHLSSISVREDQYVSKGQVIGLSGNTGFSSGPHLHFEVRSGGIPANPLNYIQ